MKRSKACMCITLLILIPLVVDTVSIFAESTSPLGFVGIVSKSDHRKAGSQFTFANVGSHRPFVTYPSGFGNETIKLYEDDDLTVFLYVASTTGSTETYYLNKKTKRFTIIEVGAWEAVAEGKDFVPRVTYGNLK